MAIQNQSHGDTELLLVGDGVLVAPGVTDGAGTTAADSVLAGLALLAALEAGLWLGLEGCVVAGEVAACGDEGVELRVAVTLEAMLLTADDKLPLEPHAATSQVMTTIRTANPAQLFLTADLPEHD
jgi:hypothetical protein